MGFGASSVPAGYQVQNPIPDVSSYVPINPRPAAAGPSSASLLQGATSLIGGAAKFAGGYLGAQNQYTAAKSSATLMRSEADILDYNADLARWEGIIAEEERDIEIDEHRDSVARILGQQATFFAWGNIDLGDPRGTPAQIRLRSLYNAEYNEGIIIERGSIKKKQAKAKADLFEYKASVIRSQAPLVEAGGRAARTGSLIGLAGEALKDVGALTS
ncbi:MAG TPA: hypothetical protein ENI27_09385 [bacterium]|nr:hypothetical protein [bacterium]